jgi:hypothetical protein
LADLIIAPTRELLTNIESGLGVTLERTQVLPHGSITDFEGARAQPSKDGLLRLGFWGHLNTIKGPDILLKAVSLLPEALRNRIRIYLWGKSGRSASIAANDDGATASAPAEQARQTAPPALGRYATSGGPAPHSVHAPRCGA